MNERERSDLIEGYLRRLARELEDVPTSQRRELLEDVRGHIEEAWAASPERSRAALLNILERLGEPEALAREERERLGLADLPRQQGPDLLAVAAIVLTALFWPVGILLAWLSPRWYARDKAIATALPVLGLMLLLSTTMVASVSYGSAAVSVSQVQVIDGQQGPEQEEPFAARQPAPSTSPSPLLQLLGRALALFGLWGAPFTAALYLALRMRPHPRRAALLVPLVTGALVVVALFGALLIPLQPREGAQLIRPAPASSVEIPEGRPFSP